MDPEETYRKDIYKYCNDNIGKKVLFPGFTILWQTWKRDSDKRYDIAPKDLAILTSNIIQELSKEGILREVKKPEELDFTPYGFYEILPH
ncbi:MAG: hypothetical protein IIA85_01985 [Nanoarchaeota archaeon]|nr:hypothetical protein [Nanoarchaeota archaeon]